MKTALAGAIGVAGVGIVMAFAGVAGMRAPTGAGQLQAVWAEAQWPFPLDQWGVGKAFVCAPSDCGTKISVYVRPKIGFCNCATGVDTETELERVSDKDLVGVAAQPSGGGRPIKIGWMTGLSRSYADRNAGLLSVAYNDDCDVVVALATYENGDASAIEPAVISFLGSRPMVLWAKKELGLEFVRRDW